MISIVYSDIELHYFSRMKQRPVAECTFSDGSRAAKPGLEDPQKSLPSGREAMTDPITDRLPLPSRSVPYSLSLLHTFEAGSQLPALGRRTAANGNRETASDSWQRMQMSLKWSRAQKPHWPACTPHIAGMKPRTKPPPANRALRTNYHRFCYLSREISSVQSGIISFVKLPSLHPAPRCLPLLLSHPLSP